MAAPHRVAWAWAFSQPIHMRHALEVTLAFELWTKASSETVPVGTRRLSMPFLARRLWVSCSLCWGRKSPRSSDSKPGDPRGPPVCQVRGQPESVLDTTCFLDMAAEAQPNLPVGGACPCGLVGGG